MYERSAIVLEKYMDKIFEFNKIYNLKTNFSNYKSLIEEIANYQILSEKEGKIIQEFDENAKRIEEIQKKQNKIYEENQKLEKARSTLFEDLGEDAEVLDSKFIKIEDSIEQNNEKLIELRKEFVKCLTDFSVRQKERNKCEKAKRIAEKNHITYINKMKEEFQQINIKDVIKIKEFINSEKDSIKKELNETMTKNGRNEKIGFNQDVLKIAIKARINIAEKEAENYIIIYDKMKKLLAEIDNDNIKLNKYQKALRDVSVKLAFLEAEKEYIVGFLDYERMTVIAGVRVHKKKMEEACQNFELDMIQIHNLYELILREIANKSTKKAYKELYNKTYLKNIEDKERNFEEEVNNIKINMGTVINSNYWRIEGIKNVYTVFQNEITEKFEKDLSEFQLEESIDEDIEETISKRDIGESKIENDNSYKKYEDGYEKEEYEDNDDELDNDEYEDDDEYGDDEYEYDEYDDEYEDDEYEDDEYEDEYDDDDYEEDEYDDEYEDDEYEDEYDDEYEDDEYEEEYNEKYIEDEHESKKQEKNHKNNKAKSKKNKNDEKIIEEIDDDDWEKEIMQQLNRKRTSKSTSKKQNTNIFGKLFKDKNNKKRGTSA